MIEKKVGESRPPLEIDQILERLWTEMPEIAGALIATNLNMSEPVNAVFRDNPDSPQQHSPGWHQWGIITHSKKFGEALEGMVPECLEQWDLLSPVAGAMSQRI